MKASVILTAAGFAGLATAHGIVQEMIIDGKSYGGYQPYSDIYQNPQPQRIGWSIPSNGPVVDVTSKSIACSVDSQPGALSAPATAGSKVKFFWTEWPESHRGPTMTYLASCTSGDCRKEDPCTLDWFKIDHAGLNADGTWVSDTIIKNNNTWTVTIPKELKPGPYLMRHELLALHSSSQVSGAQFYPMCVNLEIKGTGTSVPDKTVKFPGAYKPDNEGILMNIYWPVPTSYEIPGPPLVKLISGNGSGDDGETYTESTVTPTPTPSAPVVTPPPAQTPPIVETPDATSTDSPVFESPIEAPQPTVTPTPTPYPTPIQAPVATPTPAPVVKKPHSCPRRQVKRAIREELKMRNST
ncbi:putative endoglucanase [Tirmania nivea]|nr:putative endoglucanase [Tirmania nivea]